MVGTPIAHNLRRLRSYRGFTQADLAAAADLSVQAYRNLEAARSQPRTSNLIALAQALKVSVGELVEEAPELPRVRFRAQKKLKAREQILVEVARWLRDFRELEDLLDDHRTYSLRRVATALGKKPPGPDRARAAATRVRQAFELGPHEPVRDVCGLLEANGIKVRTIRLHNDGFFGLSVGPEDGGPAVVVNTWERISVERWIYSAAHELGHLLLHLAAYDPSMEAEDREEEREADVFAAHLLMPDDAFHAKWDETRGLHIVDRVLRVKRVFGVSYKTVLHRIIEESGDSDLWRRLKNFYRERTGQTLPHKFEPEGLSGEAFEPYGPEPYGSNEPKKLIDADFAEARLPRLVREAVEREAITLSRAAEILGLPLADMRTLSRAWVG
jgi:Zn-dependent peptidase ImmA (M78 family)/DNA-binding XRE family transcriptional regulator